MRGLFLIFVGCAAVTSRVEVKSETGKPELAALVGAATTACQASRELCHLESTCQRGYLPSCVALGVALQQGQALEKDLPRAADLFEEACFKGYTLACTHYGYALYQGLGRAQSDTDAIVQLKGACDAGDVGGCRYLAVLFLASSSALGAYARPFLRQACDGNDSWSCWRLARVLHFGESGDKGTFEEVTDLYQRACKLGLEQACYVPASLPSDSTASVR